MRRLKIYRTLTLLAINLLTKQDYREFFVVFVYFSHIQRDNSGNIPRYREVLKYSHCFYLYVRRLVGTVPAALRIFDISKTTNALQKRMTLNVNLSTRMLTSLVLSNTLPKPFSCIRLQITNNIRRTPTHSSFGLESGRPPPTTSY